VDDSEKQQLSQDETSSEAKKMNKTMHTEEAVTTTITIKMPWRTLRKLQHSNASESNEVMYKICGKECSD
jgi:hypothetical protein